MARGNRSGSGAVTPPSGYQPTDDDDDIFGGDDTAVNNEATDDEGQSMEEYEGSTYGGNGAVEPAETVTTPAAQATEKPKTGGRPAYQDIPCIDTQGAIRANAAFREGRRVDKVLVNDVFVYRVYA